MLPATWEKIVRDIASELALVDLFPPLTGNIDSDCIVRLMSQYKILDMDNSRQELYKKVNYTSKNAIFLFLELIFKGKITPCS